MGKVPFRVSSPTLVKHTRAQCAIYLVSYKKLYGYIFVKINNSFNYSFMIETIKMVKFVVIKVKKLLYKLTLYLYNNFST